ncbi:MAG: hypothetical protein VKN13_02320 [Cyanobacteriota bacterium]|nr:hypothetical protein [Cyanobacteriota bacterium]
MLRSILVLWLVALAASALLVAAGNHWPDPLPVQPPLVVLLVLGPPLLVVGWLLVGWRR